MLEHIQGLYQQRGIERIGEEVQCYYSDEDKLAIYHGLFAQRFAAEADAEEVTSAISAIACRVLLQHRSSIACARDATVHQLVDAVDKWCAETEVTEAQRQFSHALARDYAFSVMHALHSSWKARACERLKAEHQPSDAYDTCFVQCDFCADPLYFHFSRLRYRAVGGDEWFLGQVRRNTLHGHGTYRWADGASYTGGFVDGKMHGRSVYRSADGAVYRGDMCNGRWEGSGMWSFPDGSCLEGQWQKGKLHGVGKAVFRDGSTYEGEWEGGMPRGQGRFLCPNGSLFEGTVLDSREAYGRMQYTNGDVYQGTHSPSDCLLITSRCVCRQLS